MRPCSRRAMSSLSRLFVMVLFGHRNICSSVSSVHLHPGQWELPVLWASMCFVGSQLCMILLVCIFLTAGCAWRICCFWWEVIHCPLMRRRALEPIYGGERMVLGGCWVPVVFAVAATCAASVANLSHSTFRHAGRLSFDLFLAPSGSSGGVCLPRSR